jgi:hypothetical protein
MSPEEETRRLLDELVRRYGRARVVRFSERFLSRKVADTLPRSRGYAGPPFTHGASTARTRRPCQ